jgi:hypothetical protein
VEEGSEVLCKGENLGVISFAIRRDYFGKENEIFLLKEKGRIYDVKAAFYSSRIPGV